jgi:ethanolamine permease
MALAKMRSVVVSANKVQPSSDHLPSSVKEPNTREPQTTTTGPTATIAPAKYKPGKLDVFMLGLTIVIGGQYSDWNEGLHSGLYSFLIAYFLIGMGYILLCCCTAEINGALPFAGGAYGLARCTLGFYPAFMIGCCDATEYIVYVSASVISLTELMLEAAPGLKAYQPLVWAAFYVVALSITIKGDRLFWVVNGVLGSLALLVLLVYCFGSLPFVQIRR